MTDSDKPQSPAEGLHTTPEGAPAADRPTRTAEPPQTITDQTQRTRVATARVPAPWLALLGLAGFWFVVARLLSPQWSVYAQYNYGWAVPFLCLYLAWNRWPDRPAPTAPRILPGVALWFVIVLLLVPSRVIVEANLIWRFGSLAMGVELVGLTLCVLYLLGGAAWLRHFGFAVVFFLIAIPWPTLLESLVTQNLMRINTAIVVEVLTALGIPALPHGNVIEISTGLVGIDEACSGIRSLQATLMIAMFFGELYRLSVRRRVLLVASGVALAFACNMARTFLLVWVCSRSGLGAMEKWHDPTGIAILLICFTGLWLVSVKLRVAPPAPDVAREVDTSWPQLRPRWMGATLVASLCAVEGGNAAWFSLRERAGANLVNWTVRWPTGSPNYRDIELSRRVREEMKFREGHSAGWADEAGHVWQVFYFRWGPAANLTERTVVQFAKGHRPEVCLPASGMEMRDQRGVMDFEANGLTLPFRAFRFEDRSRPLFVYFCAWEDGTRGVAANMRENSASRLAAALAGSRSVSQRVIEIAIWGCQSAEEADAALRKQLPELIQH